MALRNLILEHGIVKHITSTLSNIKKLNVLTLRNCASLIKVLIRGKPNPPLIEIQGLYPFCFAFVTTGVSDDDVISSGMWCIAEWANLVPEKVATNRKFKEILQIGHTSDQPSISFPVLRIMGSILACKNNTAQLVIVNGGLHNISKALGSSSKEIRCEAAFCCSNICAGSN